MACCSLVTAENCALWLTTLAERTLWYMRMDWAFFRYPSTSRSTTFSQWENADSRGGTGTILVSSLKDGLTSVSASHSVKHGDLSPPSGPNGNGIRSRRGHPGLSAFA